MCLMAIFLKTCFINTSQQLRPERIAMKILESLAWIFLYGLSCCLWSTGAKKKIQMIEEGELGVDKKNPTILIPLPQGGTYVILYECVNNTTGTWIGIFVLLALYTTFASQNLLTILLKLEYYLEVASFWVLILKRTTNRYIIYICLKYLKLVKRVVVLNIHYNIYKSKLILNITSTKIKDSLYMCQDRNHVTILISINNIEKYPKPVERVVNSKSIIF
ncbi:hypothetical protein ACJX0J_022366 [Zea mays]